jgi:hypothetical protein
MRRAPDLDACGVNYDSIESAGEFDSREGASMASTTGTEELGTSVVDLVEIERLFGGVADLWPPKSESPSS